MKHITQMYHTKIKNQALNTSFSFKHSQIDHYLSKYTSTQQKIREYILRYIDYPFIKLSNEHIAKAVGCSVITVIRATNKFHNDGFITKHQENRYTSNSYTPRVLIDHKNKKIIQSEYDIPNKNLTLILEDSLFSNPVCSVPVQMRMREMTHMNNRILNKPRSKKRRKIVNEAMKHMILQNKHSPQAKEAILTPHIWADVITLTIEKISQLFELNKQEQFKLIAFREDVLKHTLERVEEAFEKYQLTGYRFRNRLQWVITVAEEYAKTNNIKIDWNWYYELCSILQISKETPGRPFVIQKTKSVRKDSQKGYDNDWQTMQKSLPLEARIEKWKSEIKRYEQLLAHFPNKGYGGVGYIERMIFNAKDELKSAEEKLRSSNEKQVLLRQDGSHSMAESSSQQQQVLQCTDNQQSLFWSALEPTA